MRSACRRVSGSEGWHKSCLFVRVAKTENKRAGKEEEWTEAHELLGNHASHTDSDDIQAPVPGPAEKVEQFDQVERHLARRVGPAGRVAPPDSSVVEDEDGVSR